MPSDVRNRETIIQAGIEGFEEALSRMGITHELVAAQANTFEGQMAQLNRTGQPLDGRRRPRGDAVRHGAGLRGDGDPSPTPGGYHVHDADGPAPSLKAENAPYLLNRSRGGFSAPDLDGPAPTFSPPPLATSRPFEESAASSPSSS